MITPQHRFVYILLSVMISALLTCGMTVWYVNRAINENNQIMCDILQAIYQPTPETPVPSTTDPAQRRSSDIRRTIGDSIRRYDCR